MNATGINHSHQAEHKMQELFTELLRHDGFGEFRVEVRILKRKQKEVIIHCGKQYRFVIDVNSSLSTCPDKKHV